MNRHSYIMMVDDDQAILNMLNRVLDFEGYNTPETTNERAVISLLEESKPNLVILDITMPDLEGFQAQNLMQGGSSTPVIMLTARCEVTTLQDAGLLGGDGELKQPLQKQALLSRIGSKLRDTLLVHRRRD
jgi:DNA-binding response OmpR family regulator